MKVVFSHGKESGPWGSKITKLANLSKALGLEVDSLDYTAVVNPDERVTKLNNYLQRETQPYILVGSSMGGYVSLVAAQANKPQGIFLLAPALYMPDYQHQSYPTDLSNVEIAHGWSDNIIPIDNSIKYAHQAKCTLHLIDGDHRLNASIEQVLQLYRTFLLRI
ncbi:YqiA/YcfP family alpha/beta fold hydrolase [Aliiglaciecola sp. LCG003]|uniref:YqiA/YcfP family alpha/beta fold hydrolase n=1 Tax=Aliiglaciecola sp. LCG003 TaxID=3053655 RepID=UPI0025741DE7|nr:YqiA/YcfP family alpha/beta fold hydrolase [Aliiglaciecola sp. LCG003]WJG09909.1 YqiA/YcfP family alpha/beta fold hydrolase [Aliiglaciecola sp. LCG003]